MKKIKVYVCGVDYQHEIGEADDGNKIFPSVDSIKRHMPCVTEGDGIVECELIFKRWVVKQDLDKMIKTAIPLDKMNRLQIKQVKKKIKDLQKLLKRLEKES